MYSILCFLLVLLLKIVPKHSDEVLSNVSKHKKASCGKSVLDDIHQGKNFRRMNMNNIYSILKSYIQGYILTG